MADPADGSVQVLHRTGQWCPGWRIGTAVAYDMTISPEYRVPGQTDAADRSYLLLGQGIQLTRPGAFVGGPVEGWWYIDLVAVEQTDRGLVVRDMYVDFLVPPDAHRYEVLDLDELADALAAGHVTPGECATTLRQAQRFLDDHLLSPGLGENLDSRVFPPMSIASLKDMPAFVSA